MAVLGVGEVERDRELSREEDCSSSSSVSRCVGDGGMFALGAVWNGRSVGEMYRRPVDGPGTDMVAVLSISSSIGVIGGGGVPGGEGEFIGLAARGEEAMGADDASPARGARRERCDRRDRDDAPAGEPTVMGVTSPPAASNMLPRSLPYGGGGASVPALGAKPHFLTFASMKTKPD